MKRKARVARRGGEQRRPLTGMFIVTTEDGSAIDVGHGDERLRLDFTVDKAIEVAASIAIAALPVAVRQGMTVDDFMSALAETMGRKLAEGTRSAAGGPS